MRTIWKKIGIKPEWVHGLDELTSCFMVAGYALTFVVFLMRPHAAGQIVGGAPAWGTIDEMICRSDLNVSAPYRYVENGLTFTGQSTVHFMFNKPNESPKVLFAIPQRLEPFDKEGYRALVGAINSLICEI